jgi:hypothetical protein
LASGCKGNDIYACLMKPHDILKIKHAWYFFTEYSICPLLGPYETCSSEVPAVAEERADHRNVTVEPDQTVRSRYVKICELSIMVDSESVAKKSGN